MAKDNYKILSSCNPAVDSDKVKIHLQCFEVFPLICSVGSEKGKIASVRQPLAIHKNYNPVMNFVIFKTLLLLQYESSVNATIEK